MSVHHRTVELKCLDFKCDFLEIFRALLGTVGEDNVSQVPKIVKIRSYAVWGDFVGGQPCFELLERNFWHEVRQKYLIVHQACDKLFFLKIKEFLKVVILPINIFEKLFL